LTQLFIDINVRFFEYMATCFDRHLGRHEANILHKINYHCLLNLHVDRLRSKSLLKTQHTLHMSLSVTLMKICG